MGISLLATAKVVIEVVHKVIQLHEAGVDHEIANDIHEVIEHAKSVIDDHHDTHVDNT